MTEIRLLEQLHANTRKTRITYSGRVNGTDAAIKCYLKPAFGIFHTIRAFVRGKRLRDVGAPLPGIVFAGWVSESSCFGYATEFLSGYGSMRQKLAEAPLDERVALSAALGSTVALLHNLGVEQKDGNLTNFMINDAADIVLIDEDDIRLRRGGLPVTAAVENLANIAARLPDLLLVESLQVSYLEKVSEKHRRKWDEDAFLEKTKATRLSFEKKRALRNIAPRHFD